MARYGGASGVDARAAPLPIWRWSLLDRCCSATANLLYERSVWRAVGRNGRALPPWKRRLHNDILYDFDMPAAMTRKVIVGWKFCGGGVLYFIRTRTRRMRAFKRCGRRLVAVVHGGRVLKIDRNRQTAFVPLRPIKLGKFIVLSEPVSYRVYIYIYIPGRTRTVNSQIAPNSITATRYGRGREKALRRPIIRRLVRWIANRTWRVEWSRGWHNLTLSPLLVWTDGA